MPGETARQNGKLGGRPRLEATKLREALIRKAEANAEKLADSIIGKALGLKENKNADVQAHKEILDRVIGKPVQGIDHTTNGKEMPAPILGGLTRK